MSFTSFREPPDDLRECEVKTSATGQYHFFFHRASGWISKMLTREEVDYELAKNEAYHAQKQEAYSHQCDMARPTPLKGETP